MLDVAILNYIPSDAGNRISSALRAVLGLQSALSSSRGGHHLHAPLARSGEVDSRPTLWPSEVTNTLHTLPQHSHLTQSPSFHCISQNRLHGAMVALFVFRGPGHLRMIAMCSMGVGTASEADARTDTGGNACSVALALGSDHLEGGLPGELSDPWHVSAYHS